VKLLLPALLFLAMAAVGGWVLGSTGGDQDVLIAIGMYTGVGLLAGASRLVARPLPWALAGLLVLGYVGYFVVWSGIDMVRCPDCQDGDLTRFGYWWVFMLVWGMLTAWVVAGIALGAMIAGQLRARPLLDRGHSPPAPSRQG